MKIEVEVNNKTEHPLSVPFFSEVVRKTLERSGMAFFEKKDVVLSIAVVEESEIKKINKEYRKKNEPTDVLSFAEYENIAKASESTEKELFLGEIILCYNYIKEYCEENKISLEQEMANVISHGVLHLLGFDHGHLMFSIQSEVSRDIHSLKL